MEILGEVKEGKLEEVKEWISNQIKVLELNQPRGDAMDIEGSDKKINNGTLGSLTL